VDAAIRKDIETGIADLKAALEKSDDAEIKAKSQSLAAAAMKMGEAIYAKSQSAAPDGGNGAGDAAGAKPEGGDDVVDADFEEVKDDKKSA
jgi:molecular chaperone DnaK